jgi:hypothetical protein
MQPHLRGRLVSRYWAPPQTARPAGWCSRERVRFVLLATMEVGGEDIVG